MNTVYSAVQNQNSKAIVFRQRGTRLSTFSSMGLSVAIVAMNEEAIIGRTLESVRWADEIVVVDSGSTDRTCEIAREYGAKVLLKTWPGFSAAEDLCLRELYPRLDLVAGCRRGSHP